MAPRGRPAPAAVERFWRWFEANDDRLFHFERDQEPVFDSLAAALNAVDADLTFEFGPVENGRREFVISAGGIKRAFDAVERLKAGAPPLPRWKIVAFRPRRPVENVIDLGGITVDPADVQYSLLSSKSKLGLYLYIPGYVEGDARFGQAGYLLLDEALGEYDVEMKVGLIQMLPSDATPGGARYPLRELPGHFDEAYRRLMAGF